MIEKHSARPKSSWVKKQGSWRGSCKRLEGEDGGKIGSWVALRDDQSSTPTGLRASTSACSQGKYHSQNCGPTRGTKAKENLKKSRKMTALIFVSGRWLLRARNRRTTRGRHHARAPTLPRNLVSSPSSRNSALQHPKYMLSPATAASSSPSVWRGLRITTDDLGVTNPGFVRVVTLLFI